MNDLISRQAAIDAHYEYCNKHPDAGFPVWSLKILENLPSAQPDSKELSFTHKALDTISRQDAIRIVDGIDTWQAGWRGDAIESMKALPSAQPETHDKRTETHACDLIDRQAAIDAEDDKWN